MSARTAEQRAKETARKNRYRARQREERSVEEHEMAPAVHGLFGQIRELVGVNQKLAEANARMAVALAEICGRIGDTLGRPTGQVGTSHAVPSVSRAVPSVSQAAVTASRAETEIPFSSREDSETSKTSSGDLKIDPRADARDVPTCPADVPLCPADVPSDVPPVGPVEDASGLRPANAILTNGHSRPTNVTADGCFGAAVAGWVAGIKAVTGKAFTTPRSGSAELAKLVDAMLEHCPKVEEREAWARAKGEAFARARAGRTLNAHAFVDWLNSPEAPAPIAPSETPAAKERRAREDADRRAYEAEAVPLRPEDAERLAAIAGRIGKRVGE